MRKVLLSVDGSGSAFQAAMYVICRIVKPPLILNC